MNKRDLMVINIRKRAFNRVVSTIGPTIHNSVSIHIVVRVNAQITVSLSFIKSMSYIYAERVLCGD